MSKTFVLLLQVFMTFIMATVMSGLMSLIATGPSLDWLACSRRSATRAE